MNLICKCEHECSEADTTIKALRNINSIVTMTAQFVKTDNIKIITTANSEIILIKRTLMQPENHQQITTSVLLKSLENQYKNSETSEKLM